MAINVKIKEKIEEKSSETKGMKEDLLNVLSAVEADKQPKRIISKIVSNIKE